jgi:hypothetical protein
VTATESDRQVLVAEPFQLRVTGLLHGRQQVLRRKRRIEAVQQLTVTFVDARIEMADKPAEIGGRHPVLVVEDSAAKDVEQHVGVVMRRHGFLGRGLQSVRGCHDACQFVAARLDRARHGLGRIGRIREPPDEIEDLPLRPPDIGDDLPAPRLAGPKHEPG